MKRILLVSPFPPVIGGVSVSVQRLYEHLRKEGYDVEKFNTQIGNMKYNRRALRFIRYFSLPLVLVFRRRYDVIHFHVSNVIPKLYVSLWRQLFHKKTRFIITIHGQVRDAFKTGLGYYSLKGFDRIICVKKGDRRDIPPEFISKTVEIPAFIPPYVEEEYNRLPDDLESFLSRDSFKILVNGFIILNGSHHDLYGFKDAITLLHKLREQGRKADLILIVLGTDNNREALVFTRELKSYITSKNLDNNVLWIEGPSMELWPVLKRVNVLLRPTKTDGDAMSVREALYMKIPVISSNAVTRPSGTLVYRLNSPEDLLNKTISLMDNYENYVSCIGTHNTNFAYKIIEQYENHF